MQGMGSTIMPLPALVPVISIWIATEHFSDTWAKCNSCGAVANIYQYGCSYYCVEYSYL